MNQPEPIRVAATLAEVTALLKIEQDIRYATYARIDVLTLKALALTLLEVRPDAAFLELAEGDQSDTDVFATGLRDGDGNELAFDVTDDDDISDLVGGLVSYRLNDYIGVEKTGDFSPAWKLDLRDAATFRLPAPRLTAKTNDVDHNEFHERSVLPFPFALCVRCVAEKQAIGEWL